MQIKENYALPVYSRNGISTISDSEIQFTINDQLFLETLLMEIRGKTISYSSFIKKRNNEKEKKIVTEMNRLEENYEQNIGLINGKKKELENLRNHRLIGMVRSLNYGYKVRELSVTQKQGIITCIPKDGKSKFFF